MAVTILTVIFLLSVVLVLLGLDLRGVGRRPKSLPPGPPTLPLIGNLHLMPKKRGHEQFHKWAHEYGPIYSLIIGTQVVIVLSSDIVVRELLDKRSAIYSSRPPLYLSQGVASGDLRFSFMPYNDTWRMLRRVIHRILNMRASLSYAPYQDLENKQLLVDLLDSPERFSKHIGRYTDSVATQVTFGFRSSDPDDPHVRQLYEGFARLTELMGTTGAAMFDLLPVLRRLPDFIFPKVRYAREMHRVEKQFYVEQFTNTKEAAEAGRAKPCFSVELSKLQKVEGFSDALAGYTSGVMHEGGSETSAATLEAFVQAMILHPEVQARAQEHVDALCRDRLPTMDDDLPYIRACVKEALRWHPVVILGLPHAVTRDDEYMGYRIPGGATVILNAWAIHMDPKRYPNPHHFDPSRFEGDNTTASESANHSDVTKRDHFGFGAGRRICPGLHIAERTLFLAIARLAWGFDISKAVDDNEEDLTPVRHDMTEGAAAHPRTFRASITPRTQVRARVMRQAWSECQGLLDEENQWRKVPEGMDVATRVTQEKKEAGAPGAFSLAL